MNLNQEEKRYDSKLSCNRCGAKTSNNITITDAEESTIFECKTKCSSCGHEDYWAYGFFESRNLGYDKADKY